MVTNKGWILIACAALLLAAGACKKSSSSTTSPTATTQTPASPTETDDFASTLPVGGTDLFPFTVGEYGTVNVTLTSVSGTGVPSTVMLSVGIGTPSDSGCTTTTSSVIGSSSAVQVTATEEPGTYCLDVADVGNLFRPAAFNVLVAHP